MSSVNNKFALLNSLVDEKPSTVASTIETVSLTSISEQLVYNSCNEEMSEIVDYLYQAKGFLLQNESMDTLDLLVKSVKYN